MLCLHSDISNKPGLIVDDMNTSTSHASDSELDSIDIKPVIVDTACFENSCLNNCVKPKSNQNQNYFDAHSLGQQISCGHQHIHHTTHLKHYIPFQHF
jgi:hypothetical protein